MTDFERPAERPPEGDWTISIDFGTAYSKAAVAPSEVSIDTRVKYVRPLMIGMEGAGSSPLMLESAIFVEKDRVLFGRHALAAASAHAPTERRALRGFKMLLSSPDLDQSLDLRFPPYIDPTGAFRQRDLIALYLAFLKRRIVRACSADPMLPSSRPMLASRFTHVPWGERGRAAARATSLLLDEAEITSAMLGDAMGDPAGVSIDAGLDALAKVRATPFQSDRWNEPVLEAVAAAACHLFARRMRSAHVLVVDIGAGTTDIGALEVSNDTVTEITEARHSLMLGGDAVDQAILSMTVERMPGRKSAAAQSALWNRLLADIRTTKETLFADGRAVVRVDGAPVTIERKHLLEYRDFRDFLQTVREAYGDALSVVARRARAQGATSVSVVTAGGGANLGPIQAMIAKTARMHGVAVQVERAAPGWARDPRFLGQLEPVFAQLSIALGGALAPDTLVQAG